MMVLMLDTPARREVRGVWLSSALALALIAAPDRAAAQALETPVPPAPAVNRPPELAPPPRAEPPAPALAGEVRRTIIPAQPMERVAPTSPPPAELGAESDVVPAAPPPPEPLRTVPPASPPQRVTVADPSASGSSAAASPPPGATMRCRNGEYLTGDALSSRCDDKGGVAIVIPQPPPPPPEPLP
jgi:hypothetical protein